MDFTTNEFCQDIALQEPAMLAEIRPAAIRQAFTVERITDEAALDAIRDDWNELLQSSRADCLFLTWEWAATWWKYLGAPGRLIVLAVRHQATTGELIALAPFRLRPSRLLHKQPFPVLEFLGSGFVGSDYLDLIVRQGYESDAVEALDRMFLVPRGPAVVSQNGPTWLAGANSLAAGLAARLNTRGWSLDEIQTNICPYIPLEGHSWESYLATSLGAEHRADFRRKWNRLNRDFDVRFEAADAIPMSAPSPSIC